MPDSPTEIASAGGQPYVSLVVTARNDDHGGNLLGRMQAFVAGWIAQANRHGIPSELIIVEWNPPSNRPRLRDVLDWPSPTGCCEVRFIEVPPDVHARFAHAQALPLYQMIGKNVGIRRARGSFILATNIDILFSDELAAFLAERRLQRGYMYRMDRHDVMSDVPAHGSIDEQLAYCSQHLIRVNSREGTFPLSPEGEPALANEDLASPESGIVFGLGWYAVERYGRQAPFRWAGPRAELLVQRPAGPGGALKLDIEPGPGTGGHPLLLEITSEDGTPLADVRIGWRCLLELPADAASTRRMILRARNGGLATSLDPRILDFRVFQVDWDTGSRAKRPTLRPIGLMARCRIFLAMLDHVVARLASGGSNVSLSVPVSSRMRRLLRSYMKIRHPHADIPRELNPLPPTLFLHTNGCGDFTLMAREHWFDLRAYAEFDLFSMNLDSLFCAAAHYGGVREAILRDPMRIYHIEHGTGSGWTPEGQSLLFDRLAAKGIPHLDNDDVLRWAAQMQRLNSPMIFNHENWGMADLELPEIRIQ